MIWYDIPSSYAIRRKKFWRTFIENGALGEVNPFDALNTLMRRSKEIYGWETFFTVKYKGAGSILETEKMVK